MKRCLDCKQDLPDTQFQKRTGRAALSTYCSDCHARRNRERRLQHRMDVLSHYSGGPPRCACCAEASLEFLALDHINGGGGQERRKKIPGYINIATWLRNQGYPPGFRVLCHNCNHALGIYGYCPHVSEGSKFDGINIVERYPSSSLYCKYGHPMFGSQLRFRTREDSARRRCKVCAKIKTAKRALLRRQARSSGRSASS